MSAIRKQLRAPVEKVPKHKPGENLPDKLVFCCKCREKGTSGNKLGIVERETGAGLPQKLIEERGYDKAFPTHGYCKPCADDLMREAREYLQRQMAEKGLKEGPRN